MSAELDDLVRRNRLLIAKAAHVASDTVWLRECVAMSAIESCVGTCGDLRRCSPTN